MTPEAVRDAMLGRSRPPLDLPSDLPFASPAGVLGALAEATRRSSPGAAVALSGGLDSAIVLALAGPAKRAWSMTDGDPDPDLDMARVLAARYGAAHEVVVVPEADLPDGFEAAVRAVGAPLVNGLAVAKHRFFAALAASGETAALSGVGADEAFHGNPGAVDAELPAIRLAATLLLPEWQTALPVSVYSDPRRRAFLRTLPELTLVAERDMAAAHGVEVRLPFLDPAVAGPALATPLAAQVRGSLGKWTLREAARGIVPEALRLAPKTPRLRRVAGARWIALLDGLLSETRVRELGVLDPRSVRRLLARHAAQPDPVADRVLMRAASLVVLSTASRLPLPRAGRTS